MENETTTMEELAAKEEAVETTVDPKKAEETPAEVAPEVAPEEGVI